MDYYHNQVEELGAILLVTLTLDKKAIVDNDERVKEILRKYKFCAIKRQRFGGGDVYYAVSISVRTGRNYLHRLILGLESVAGKNVHYNDGNTLNCCRSNLVVKATKDLLTDAKRLHNPIVGVHRRKNGWVAVWTNGQGDRRYKLFSFKYNTPERAYELAAQYRVSRHAGNPWSMQ